MVTKASSSSQPRHHVLRITEAGRSAWRRAEEQRIDVLTGLLDSVSSAEEETVERLLALLKTMTTRATKLGQLDPRYWRQARYVERDNLRRH